MQAQHDASIESAAKAQPLQFNIEICPLEGDMQYLGALPSDNLGHLFGLLAAVVLGACIGFERHLRGQPGLHTNAVVALGAAAFVIADALVGGNSGQVRIAGQVATGIGFLCAGVIMHQGATVRGLNTAATVWCSATVGVLAGFGMILWAAVVAVLLIVANVILHYLEHRILPIPTEESEPDKETH